MYQFRRKIFSIFSMHIKFTRFYFTLPIVHPKKGTKIRTREKFERINQNIILNMKYKKFSSIRDVEKNIRGVKVYINRFFVILTEMVSFIPKLVRQKL